MSTINLANGNTLLSTGAFPPVRAASTGSPLNPATGGLLTVDGITLTVGDRVLVKDESSAINNGIYAAQTGPWIRTSDAQSNTQLFPGMTVTVGPGGAVNAGKTYVCTCTDDPVNVGTSQITWAAQSDVQTAQQTATSTTSLTIGAGSKTLTIQSGKAFLVNQEVLIYETSNTANSMLGQVTAYAGTSLTVNVTNTAGSGTHADWTVVLYNSVAAAGITPPIGTGNVTGPGSATDGNLAVFSGTSGLIIKDGGVPVGAANTLTPVMFTNAALGFALGMFNGKIVTSEAGNALTIAIKTLAGTDPTSTDATFFFITDGAGGWTTIKLTAALSLTVPAGATLNTVNGQAGRQYIGVFNNAGTPVLGIYNSLIPTAGQQSVVCWDETSAVNGTGISSGSTSAQIWYTASTVTGKFFRVIASLESTQATAGQWASPVTAKLFGPGNKKPSDAIQEVTAAISTQDTTNSTTFVATTNNRLSITVQSAANLVRVEASGTLGSTAQSLATVAGGSKAQLSRGTVAATSLIGNQLQEEIDIVTGTGNPTGFINAPAFLLGYDQPGSGSVTYAVQMAVFGATTASYGGNTVMAAKEIQI